MEIKELRKKLNLKNKEIAKAFGYKNERSFLSSSGKNKIEKGIIWFYTKIKENENKNFYEIKKSKK